MPTPPRRRGTEAVRSRRISVRRRLLAMLLALFVAGLGALYLLVRGYAQQTADTTYDQLLRASVLSMADSLQLVQDEWQMDMPYAALALLEQAPRDRVFYRVAAADGALISGYAGLSAPPGHGADAGAAPQLFTTDYQGQPVRVAWMERKIAGPRATESALIQVAQTREARNALAESILWQGTLTLIGFTAAALALAYWEMCIRDRGLTISRGIIESHGGRLWAEPAAREGAVFCFMLPAAAEDESS